MRQNPEIFLQRVTPQKKIQLLKAQLTQVENYQDKTDFEQQWKNQRIVELTKEIKNASVVMDCRV